MDINYLKRQGEQWKYDSVKSCLVLGKHPKKPQFSIIIPTYQRPAYLRQSLHSALNQVGVDNYEIVVVDNDSGTQEVNKTLEVIREINSAKVVYYKNVENIGIYGNTLRASQLARGTYVVLLNDDDLLHPYYLLVIDQLQKKHHYYGIIGSAPSEFHGDQHEFKNLPDEILSFQITEIEYFFGCCVTSPGMCWPKKITYEIWNAYEKLLMGDQIIQYQSLKKYGLYFISFPLALYRIGENETLKEDRLLDMMYHMCRFKIQIAKRNLFLNVFMKVFRNEYLYWYVHSNFQFWNQRGMEHKLLSMLHLKRPAKYSVKYFLTERMVGQVHFYFVKKHNKSVDRIFLRNKTMDKLIYDSEKRKRFLKLLQKHSFVHASELAGNDKYDIALLGRWNTEDFGEILSGAALYHVLTELGYEALLIDGTHTQERRFPSYFYETCRVSRQYTSLDEWFALNEVCDTFLVKCDDSQTKTQKPFNLQFLKSGKKKIYYESYKQDMDVFWEPILLRTRRDYIKEAEKSNRKMPESFVFYYVMKIDEKVQKKLRLFEKETDEKVISYAGKNAENPNGLILEHAVYGLTVSDVLAYIGYADCLVTDSYYAICLALVLHRPFLVLLHDEADANLKKLLRWLGLEGRIMGCTERDIDWDCIEQKLEICRSLEIKWLKDQIEKK